MTLRKNSLAFTLIELLVTIGIIAILAAILLPAIKAALDKAHKAQAQHEISGIANAIKSYYNEYSKYPTLQVPYPATDTSFGKGGATADNKDIISVLTGNNPRKISFLELSSTSTNATGNAIDPWDNAYGIGLDYNFDNSVVSGAAGIGTVGGRGVIVWSAGQDGTVGTADDIKSW